MRVSREQMQANRRRILDAASRMFREKGFEAVSVAEVMKAAGLTHGGFYGHFESKDDLIAQTVAHIFDGGEGGLDSGGVVSRPGEFLDAYLSSRHRDNIAEGCPTAALIADVRRQTPAARKAMAAGVRSQIDHVAETIGGADAAMGRRQAIGAWATLVGALVLARTIDDPALSDEILKEARAWLGERASPSFD